MSLNYRPQTWAKNTRPRWYLWVAENKLEWKDHFASLCFQTTGTHRAALGEQRALPRLRIASRTGINNMPTKNLLPFVLFFHREGLRAWIRWDRRMQSASLTKVAARGCQWSPFPLVSHEAKQSLKTVLQVFPLTDRDKFCCDIGSPSFKACIKSERSTTFGNVGPDGLQPCGTLRYCFSLNPKVCSLELCEDSLRVWNCTALDAGFLFHPAR